MIHWGFHYGTPWWESEDGLRLHYIGMHLLTKDDRKKSQRGAYSDVPSHIARVPLAQGFASNQGTDLQMNSSA